MQDRYAGDLGDFLKLSLLRWLTVGDGCSEALRLGVVWYLVPDEVHNADGKHVGYLDPAHRSALRFQTLDPDLYRRLSDMAKAEPVRSVAGLERSGTLPTGALTFSDPLTFDGLPVADKVARLKRRSSWLGAALEATAECDLVFVDPDNAFDLVLTVRRGIGTSPKSTPTSMRSKRSWIEVRALSHTTTPIAQLPSWSRHSDACPSLLLNAACNRSPPYGHPPEPFDFSS